MGPIEVLISVIVGGLGAACGHSISSLKRDAMIRRLKHELGLRNNKIHIMKRTIKIMEKKLATQNSFRKDKIQSEQILRALSQFHDGRNPYKNFDYDDFNRRYAQFQNELQTIESDYRNLEVIDDDMMGTIEEEIRDIHESMQRFKTGLESTMKKQDQNHDISSNSTTSQDIQRIETHHNDSPDLRSADRLSDSNIRSESHWSHAGHADHGGSSTTD